MTDIMQLDANKFVVPGSNFDSRLRYFRETAGGELAISGGRTFAIAATGDINNGQPWVGFRFDCRVDSIDFDTTTVSGSPQTQDVPEVNSTVALCTS